MSEMTIAEWSEGRECERHLTSWCADCRDFAKIVRDSAGELRYAGDCAVQSYREITGAGYEEAVSALREVGYRPGYGTPAEGLGKALREGGYDVRRTSARYADLGWLTKGTGRVYIVGGYKGRKGHSWTVIDGIANRPYFPPFKYDIYEVTA